MNLQDKNVVITGGSSGIGRKLVEALLEKGAFVLAVSRTVESSLDFKHKRLFLKNADMTREDELDAVFTYAIDMLGSIDGFIANAGFAYYERFDVADMKHIKAIIDTNVTSVMYTAAKMREIQSDKPFNFMVTLSAVSFVSMPGYALYSATKAALRAFVEALRFEVKSNQIIQAVYPVATETNFFKVADQSRKPWPVQSVDRVVKSMLKGLEKDKKDIYPSKLFKWSHRLTPWFYRFYLKREQKHFLNTMESNKP